jgi:uncharacterized protein (TIGR02453 family)
MAWFTKEYEAFFKALEKNNEREWFQANKKQYEKEVKKPFEQFITDMILRMQHYDPACKIVAKDAIFRIHRDIRFSKDKTPYKTRMSAVVGRGGRKETTLAGMYLELGNRHCRIYGGVYQPDKDQLFKIRQEIAYNLDEFNAILDDARFKSTFETIRGEQHKRLPPAFKDVHEQQPLIANKQFYYYADLDPDLITSDGLVDALYQAYEIGLPMRNFLFAALED